MNISTEYIESELEKWNCEPISWNHLNVTFRCLTINGFNDDERDNHIFTRQISNYFNRPRQKPWCKICGLIKKKEYLGKNLLKMV